MLVSNVFFHLRTIFLQVDDNEGHLERRACQLYFPIVWGAAHFDILALLVADHHLDDEVLGVRRERLLAHELDELAELHRQALLALYSHNCRQFTLYGM